MVIIQLDSEQFFGIIENAVRKVIDEKEQPAASIHAPRKVMSLAELCEYTGMSKQSIYKLTSAQKVPHSKRGKRLYFEREKVDAWLVENRVKTDRELAQQANEYLSQKSNQRRTQPRAAR